MCYDSSSIANCSVLSHAEQLDRHANTLGHKVWVWRHQQGAIMTPTTDECSIKASRSTQGGGQVFSIHWLFHPGDQSLSPVWSQ